MEVKMESSGNNHTGKHSHHEHHDGERHHAHRRPHKPSKDSADFYKRKTLSSAARRKKISRIAFFVLCLFAIAIVGVCIYVYSA